MRLLLPNHENQSSRTAQAGTATEVSPTIRSSIQARGGKRARAVPSSDSDDEDEIVVSGAATTSEEQGQDPTYLREVGPAPSAQPHSKASFCRLLYLCGIVEVAFPSRKHGMSGTRPRRSSTFPT